jgi:hypothetical protein
MRLVFFCSSLHQSTASRATRLIQSVEEPDALMHACPAPGEPWRLPTRAIQPSVRKRRPEDEAAGLVLWPGSHSEIHRLTVG